MGRREAEARSAESEYRTVPELAKMVRRNRKTDGWIATGEIGEVDGLFVVQGRFLIHWPTFRAKQFKPREKLRGQVPEFSEENILLRLCKLRRPLCRPSATFGPLLGLGNSNTNRFTLIITLFQQCIGDLDRLQAHF